jgi:serine/threonine protein kinase
MPPPSTAHVPGSLTPDPLAGTRYSARSLIDEGGMGAVYLAEHTELGHQVVIKLLHARVAQDRDMIDRVRLEAQTLAGLKHPHLVLVTDAGYTPDGRPFMAMEKLVGCTLQEELVKRGALPLGEAIDIVRAVLQGLAAAHAKGVVHRDVKPGNVFLHVHQGRRIPKLLDFGIAKVVREVAGGPRPIAVPTREGGVVGTPAYMAPEQALGRAVDVRSDIYAVALVLYKAITGRGPFDHRKSDGTLLAAHVRETPEPPSRFSQEPVPPELEAVVMKGLSKDPAQRFQTAEEMIAALDSIGQAFRKPTGWLATTAFRDGEPDAAPLPTPTGVPERTEPIPDDGGESPGPEPVPSPTRTRRFERVLFAIVVLLSAGMGAGVIAWIAAWLRGTP